MTHEVSEAVKEIARNHPRWNDKYFIMGFLTEHLKRLHSQMLVTPKNITTASDRIAEKFTQTLAADCKFLMEHLHDLTNGQEPMTDDELAARLVEINTQPTFKAV